MILKIIVLFSRQLCAAVLTSTPSTDNNDTMKTHKLGNVNAASLAAVRKNGKLVAWCSDTPNAAAYAMAKTGADEVQSRDCRFARNDKGMAARIAARGYFMKSDKDAGFVLA